jgi:hypothetical protein
LLFSSVWWQQSLYKEPVAIQQEALENYYSSIHPLCTLIRRLKGPSYLSPVEPYVTIERSGLLSLEETNRRMSCLFTVGGDKTLQGTSLLQLPSILQDKLVQEGEWPEDGICPTSHWSDDLAGRISKSRSSSSDLYHIPEMLMLTNADVTQPRVSEAGAAVQDVTEEGK